MKKFVAPFKAGNEHDMADNVVDADGRFVCTTKWPYSNQEKLLKKDVKSAADLADFLNKAYAAGVKP